MIKRNVIWIASYPKSGNTWVHSVLRTAGRNHGFPQVDMDVYNIIRGNTPLVVCDAVAPRYSDHPCVVLKTHSSFQPELHQIPDVELVNAGYIHIYRNPLDVLLSYINFTRLDYKRKPEDQVYQQTLFMDLLGFDRAFAYSDWLVTGLDMIPQRHLDHALDHFSDNGMRLQELRDLSGSWLGNTQSWFEAAKSIPGYSIRYEDCLVDKEQMTKLASFFTFGRDEVGFAREYEDRQALARQTDERPDDAIFYNKMSAYYFMNYFSRQAITRFLAKHEQALKAVGYENLYSML